MECSPRTQPPGHNHRLGSFVSIRRGRPIRAERRPGRRAPARGILAKIPTSNCPPVATFGKKPRMKHQIAHDLDVSLAKEVAVHSFESYQKRFVDYHPKMHWISDRDARIEFSVKG